jgi:CubicO group peptidase (beta-lactamase class C family)
MKKNFILLLLFFNMTNVRGQSSQEKQQIFAIESGLISFSQTAGKPLVTYTLADRMKFYKVPAVGIAVINNGKLQWVKVYGSAGPGNKLKADTATLFQIASQSKGINRTLAMLFVYRKKLTLDDDANNYLKTWKIPPSEYTKDQPITLRWLLSGWSGVSVQGFSGYKKGESLPNTEQILNGEKPATNDPVVVQMKPGTRELESGGAIMIVQKMLEDVTGKGYPVILHEYLTGPLKLNNTICELSERADTLNVANGFFENGEEVPGGWYMQPQYASSGIWSTATDLATYLLEIQKAIKGKSKIFSQKLALQLTDKNFRFPNEPVPSLPINDRMMFGQTSHNHGYMTFLDCSAVSGRGVVITTNSDNGQQLITEIVNGIDRVYGWGVYLPKYRIQLSSAQLKAFNGKYQFKSNPNAALQVTAEGDYLLVKMLWNGEEHKIIPTSNLNFFEEKLGLPARFVKGKDGTIEKMLVFDNEDEWDKVEDKP